MSSFSLLAAQYLERMCDEAEMPAPKKSQKEIEQSIFKRKINKLLQLLVRYQSEDIMTQKEMKSTIALLREIIPHMQKKEQAELQKVYVALDDKKPNNREHHHL